MLNNRDCVFCKIIDQQVPSEEVYKTAEAIVIKDINPETPVHLLIIPNQHFTKLTEAKETFLIEVRKILAHLENKDDSLKNGYRLVVNCGPDSGQLIDHLHIHVLAGQPLGLKIVSEVI